MYQPTCVRPIQDSTGFIDLCARNFPIRVATRSSTVALWYAVESNCTAIQQIMQQSVYTNSEQPAQRQTTSWNPSKGMCVSHVVRPSAIIIWHTD